jgi:hypothetical protein
VDPAIHKGTFPPFGLPDSYQFTARIGQRIESASQVLDTQVEAFLADLRNRGWDYTAVARVGTPYYHVEWVPRDDAKEIVTIWELAGNEAEVSIWQLPKVKVEFAKLTQHPEFYQQEAFLQRVVNGKVAGEASVPAWKKDAAGNLDMVPIATSTEFQDAIKFISLQVSTDPNYLTIAIFEGLAASLARGVESFPISHYVVRRSRQLSANTTIALEIATANYIYTLAEFIALEKPPPELKFTLPIGYYQRKTPTMTQQRDGTWLANEEWWHALDYDHFIYDSFKPPTPT